MSAAGRTAAVGLFAAFVVAGAAAGAVAQGAATGQGAAIGQGAAVAQGAATAPGGATSSHAPAWVTVPSGWRPMAELALPRAAPAGSSLSIEPASAFGDPALGCFALVQAVSVPAADFEIQPATDRIIRDLGAAGLAIGPGATASDVSFAGLGVEGRLRIAAAAEGPRVALRSVACFYNDREPARCRTTCQTMLDSAGARQ